VEAIAVKWRALITVGTLAATLGAQAKGVKPAGSKWTVSRSKSQMDGTSTVVLRLPSDNVVRGWLSRAARPVLLIRCQERVTDVYVDVGLRPHPTAGLFQRHSVRLRLDDSKAYSEDWSESTDGTALFSPDGVDMADRLAHADRLLFEFTPFSSPPAIARFDLRGLAPKLAEVARVCGWFFEYRDAAWDKTHPLQIDLTALNKCWLRVTIDEAKIPVEGYYDAGRAFLFGAKKSLRVEVYSESCWEISANGVPWKPAYKKADRDPPYFVVFQLADQ
jgi:hypothetical protein